jgi:hypothetical protein
VRTDILVEKSLPLSELMFEIGQVFGRHSECVITNETVTSTVQCYAARMITMLVPFLRSANPKQ